MASVTIDNLVGGNVVMHDHSERDLGAVLDSRYVNISGDTMTGNLVMIGANIDLGTGLLVGGGGSVGIGIGSSGYVGLNNANQTAWFAVDNPGDVPFIRTLGSITSNAGYLINASNNILHGDSATYVRLVPTWKPTANNKTLISISANIKIDSSNRTGLAIAGNVQVPRMGSAFSGTLDSFKGFNSGNSLDDGTTGTITDYFSYYVADGGASFITNKYGLYVESLTEGTSSNYAIYTNTGLVHFGDKVQFTQTDGNEAIDSLADGYMDYLATTAHRFNAPLVLASYERHRQLRADLTGTPANQPTEVDFGTASGLQFASTGSEYVFVEWEIPSDWDGGDISIEVGWFPDSGATSGTDTVKWDVEYRSIAVGETITNGTSVTVSSTDDGDHAQYQTIHAPHTIAYNNANQPLTAQDHIYFKISRDTAVANDFAGTVTVTAFEIVYNSVAVPTN